MDPYETLGITPAFDGDLKAVRNRLVKRHFEVGDVPDEERMKAINLAYAQLSEAVATRELPIARMGEPYRARLGTALVWGGQLPAGLTLVDGTLAGVPERPGSFPLTLTDRVVVLHVEPAPVRLFADALPNATIGVPYEAELRAEGGVGPLRWSGAVPAGLQLGDGVLFGTPLGPSGALSIDLRVRDRARQTATATVALIVRPASAASDRTEWTPEGFEELRHAAAVAAHEAGRDPRPRIAVLRRRLARDPAAGVVAALLAGVLALLFGPVALLLVLPALWPFLLAPARRAELERLNAQRGCGVAGCPRCESATRRGS